MGLRKYIDLVESVNEADHRSLINKLTDMIVHDGTPENERRVAVKKLASAIAAQGRRILDADVDDLLTAVSPTEHDRRRAIEKFANTQQTTGSDLKAAIKAYSRFA